MVWVGEYVGHGESNNAHGIYIRLSFGVKLAQNAKSWPSSSATIPSEIMS